jgi:hypothetical protein
LGQKHFSGSEEISNSAHAVHEGAFNDVERAGVVLSGFFDVFIDVINDAFDEGIGEAFFDGFAAPCFGLGGGFLAASVFDVFGKFDQFFGRFLGAIEHYIFDNF